jgi:hypothetical protein
LNAKNALTKMEGLSLMNRLFNQIPKNIKALTDGTGTMTQNDKVMNSKEATL